MKHHLRGLLGERLASGVDHVDEAGIGQVFDVVHHRGAAGLNVDGQLADVGGFRTVNGQLIEQTLDLREVFQLNLLDEQDIYLGHHVHGLQQVLRVVAVLLEERVEAMVHIVLEIFLRTNLGQNLLDDVLVVGQNLVEGVGLEVVAGLQVQKLPE